METIDIISGERFEGLCDLVVKDYRLRIITNPPRVVFVKTDFLRFFEEDILPQIEAPFRLITHNSDYSIADGFDGILSNPLLVKWYGMNCKTIHPKLQPIPIGIANKQWPHGNISAIEKTSQTKVERKNAVYCNFSANTNPRRAAILDRMSTLGFVDIEEKRLSFEEYLFKLKSYKFVISPIGNGIDCHRIWESIYLGCIPIVEKHICHRYWSDLPICLIDDFLYFSEIPDSSTLNANIDKSKLSHYSKMILSDE